MHIKITWHQAEGRWVVRRGGMETFCLFLSSPHSTVYTLHMTFTDYIQYRYKSMCNAVEDYSMHANVI